jgi:hypothetical protein
LCLFTDVAPAAHVVEDVIVARGHPNVTASNARTLEITKDLYVTRRGDCIIACCADKAGPELARDLLDALRRPGTVRIVVEAGGIVATITGRTPLATPTNPYRLVVRRSRYVDDSTLAVEADKAAADLPRDLVSRLRDGVVVRVGISVEPDDPA